MKFKITFSIIVQYYQNNNGFLIYLYNSPLDGIYNLRYILIK